MPGVLALICGFRGGVLAPLLAAVAAAWQPQVAKEGGSDEAKTLCLCFYVSRQHTAPTSPSNAGQKNVDVFARDGRAAHAVRMRAVLGHVLALAADGHICSPSGEDPLRMKLGAGARVEVLL